MKALADARKRKARWEARQAKPGRANKGERDLTRVVLVENRTRKGKLACHGGRV